MNSKIFGGLTIAIVAGAFAQVAGAEIHFINDVTQPAPMSGNPLTFSGVTDGVAWNASVAGSDYFNDPTRLAQGVNYTHNTASAGTSRGTTFEINFGYSVNNLTFRVADFGTRVVNYAQMGSDNSGGEQSFVVQAYLWSDQLDLSLANASAQSLIELSDNGNGIRGNSLVFDAQGNGTTVGFDRSTTFTISQPTSRVLITTTDAAITTSIIGDNVSMDHFEWSSHNVPEPTLLGLVGAGSLIALRRRAN